MSAHNQFDGLPTISFGVDDREKAADKTRAWQEAIATAYSTQNDVALRYIVADCWAKPAKTGSIRELLLVGVAVLRVDRISARLKIVASISSLAI